VEELLQIHPWFIHTAYTSCLSAISSHRLAKLPAKMPAFNIHKRKNVFCPLLPDGHPLNIVTRNSAKILATNFLAAKSC